VDVTVDAHAGKDERVLQVVAALQRRVAIAVASRARRVEKRRRVGKCRRKRMPGACAMQFAELPGSDVLPEPRFQLVEPAIE